MYKGYKITDSDIALVVALSEQTYKDPEIILALEEGAKILKDREENLTKVVSYGKTPDDSVASDKSTKIAKMWKKAKNMFSMDGAKLTSLKDAPTVIRGDFALSNNDLVQIPDAVKMAKPSLSDENVKSIQDLFSRTSNLNLILPECDAETRMSFQNRVAYAGEAEFKEILEGLTDHGDLLSVKKALLDSFGEVKDFKIKEEPKEKAANVTINKAAKFKA